MNWIALVFALELGVLPGGSVRIYDPPYDVVENLDFYQQFEARAILWDHLFVGGSVRIYDWIVKDKFSFHPFELSSIFEAGLIFGPLELGMRHGCGPHPIIPFLQGILAEHGAEGGYSEIYLRLEGSTRR
jgi:hypothetical protein